MSSGVDYIRHLMAAGVAGRPIMVPQMVRHPELSLCIAILSGHHERGPPPSKDIKSSDSSGSSFLELGQYMHIHWDVLEKVVAAWFLWLTREISALLFY